MFCGDTRKANFGGGDKTILESVEQGEDSAKEAYEEALRSQLPSNLLTIIQRQAESVTSAHDKVRSMRDSLAA